jgi:hypothetical protein
MLPGKPPDDMKAPTLFTIEETIQALRIARAAKEYVRLSEELAELMVKSEKPLDPKFELRTGEAWARLLEAVKATKIGPAPPLKKKQGAPEKRPELKTATAADSITIASAGQARSRSCLMETPLARYVRRRRLQFALTK